jgi:hypothetical protein
VKWRGYKKREAEPKVDKTTIEILLSIQPDLSMDHTTADNLAQHVLGDIEPKPGESLAEYTLRSDIAELAFRLQYPRWRSR